MRKHYFNNCLTSQPAPEVIDAMLPYFKNKFYFPENFVKTGTMIDKKLRQFKNILANSIKAKPDEIHFTTGGTAANNLAIKGYLTANASKGNHIIVSVIDYPDLLTNAAFFENSGFEVSYLQADEQGFIDLKQLEKEIKANTILFMTTMANHTVGTIQPLKKIRTILNKADHKIAMHVDACEAYGRVLIDVNDLGIDLMAVSAHKIHGPKGIGFLYQRQGIDLAPTKHGIKRMDNLETGSISIAGIAGFAKAVELAFEDLTSNINHIRSIANYLIKKIKSEIPHIIMNGAQGEKRASHNVNISFEYIEGEAIKMMLDLAGIAVATGSACASQKLQSNYVLRALGRTHEQSHGSIKFTISRYHTKEEIDYTVKQLKEIVEELRKRSPLYKE